MLEFAEWNQQRLLCAQLVFVDFDVIINENRSSVKIIFQTFFVDTMDEMCYPVFGGEVVFEFSFGKTVYDVIAAVRQLRGLSIRKLATLANISPTTLTSMLDRKPEKVPFRTLDAIAQVFDLGWMDLFNYEDDHVPEVDATGKVSVALIEGDFERIMGRLAEIKVVSPPNKLVSWNRNTHRSDWQAINGCSDEFRRSINFVLERLNSDGLVEAMRRILELEKDERYCVKAPSANKADAE